MPGVCGRPSLAPGARSRRPRRRSPAPPAAAVAARLAGVLRHPGIGAVSRLLVGRRDVSRRVGGRIVDRRPRRCGRARRWTWHTVRRPASRPRVRAARLAGCVVRGSHARNRPSADEPPVGAAHHRPPPPPGVALAAEVRDPLQQLLRLLLERAVGDVQARQPAPPIVPPGRARPSGPRRRLVPSYSGRKRGRRPRWSCPVSSSS